MIGDFSHSHPAMNLLQQELNRYHQAIAHNPNNPRNYVLRGMVQFKLANIAASIADFDRAEELDASITPYLWQRGLSYYYANRFEEGARQFEVDLQVNSQDVEETVWRYLCVARLEGVEMARKSLLPVKNDPRRVMQLVYDFYAGNCQIDSVLGVGNFFAPRPKFYSHLYVGLFFEVANQPEKAKFYVSKAVDDFPIDDYMWHLGRVHKILRGWDV